MAETPANDADPLISVKGDQDESTKQPIEDLVFINNFSLGRIALISIVFFLVCGGSYGTEDLGGAIPPFFGLLGIICVPWLWSMPIALITAELGSSMPNSGGFLLWIRRGLGDFLSYLDALIMVITIVIDLAVYPLIFISYTESLIQFTSWEQYLLCVAFIILCLGINMFGAGSVGNSSKVFTLLTLIPFGILIVFASISPDFDPNRWMVTEGDWDAGLYLSVLIWATCGYEYAGFLIGDVKNAKKTFPLAMASTVGLMTLTYLLPVGAIVAITVDPTMLSEGAYPIVAENLGGRWLALVFTGGGLVSSLGTYNAYLHTASAALSSFSEDGYIPKIFSRTLPKFNTPFVSMLFFTLTTSVLVLFDFHIVVEMESIFYSCHAIILCLTFIRLKFSEPNMERPFAVPLGKIGAIILSIFPFLVASFNIAMTDWKIQIAGFGVLLAGGSAYWIKKGVDRCMEKRNFQKSTAYTPVEDEEP